jgi:ATP-dependent protease Clp ATPase subunit
MFRQKRLACSFCGKGEADVAKLMAGPKVFICDQCVAVAIQLMEGPSADQRRPRERQLGPWRTLWHRLRMVGQPRRGHRSEYRAAASC